MVTASKEHIEIVQGAGGPKARIAGHNIRVQDVVVWHEQMGLTIDDIVQQWPSITRADVHAALAYYWDHKQEIDAKMEDDERYFEEWRQRHGPSVLDQKLKSLQKR